MRCSSHCLYSLIADYIHLTECLLTGKSGIMCVDNGNWNWKFKFDTQLNTSNNVAFIKLQVFYIWLLFHLFHHKRDL